MRYYAKSSPVETVKEHTEQLLIRFHQYKQIYQPVLSLLSERDWELLEIAVRYHDVGKVDIVFQNKIRKVIGELELDVPSSHDIPHNFLSVMAIPFKALGLNREEQKLVSQAVAYHHERGVLPNKQEIADNYQKNILPYKEIIESQLGVAIDDKVLASKMNMVDHPKRIQSDDPLYHRYILLKGLLHRLDHAASAHVPIELASEMNVAEHVQHFFLEVLKKEKKPLQQFAESHQDHHLVVVAQTGMGKTEAGLLWLGSTKGFFTLPLRVSINAMYSRITDVNNIGFGEEATGLLHSTSMEYLHEKVEGNDEVLEKVHSQSKEFANKLIISTIDQVLKFPFYYLGFEKEYATMATSKVIIDELQAYDPKIAALLIRAMKLIDDIGGSFMIMTATLPEFYLNALRRELRTSRLPLTYSEFIDDSVKRHHVAVRDESIMDEEILDEIEECGKTKKVLVICNTVDRARTVYEALYKDANVTLLHSRFTKRDRTWLEKQILNFVASEETGIWVTTQLVEASLDIDFDLLYTEMSTLDSQFQRYGRCNRKAGKPIDQVNINIFTGDVSGVSKQRRSVYHYDIYERSLALLYKHKKGLLLETAKHQMIKELYNEQELEGTTFKQDFEDTLEQLKNRPPYDTTRKEAQELLRDIQQVQVIPVQFTGCEEFQMILENWKYAPNKAEKRKYRLQLESYSVSVNKWRAEKVGINELEGIKGLYFIHCKYCSRKGLLTDSISFFD